MTEPRSAPLTMWGRPSDATALPWSRARDRLRESPIYWLTTTNEDRSPHATPVWGVWLDDRLLLTVGSPVQLRNVRQRPQVNVHLESGSDVVVVEGEAEIGDAESGWGSFLARYNLKYDWDYSIESLGPPVVIRPRAVLAWEGKGEAARDGFGAAGKWEWR
jgi:Pyridoxamine 5'-phosphate oxidase